MYEDLATSLRAKGWPEDEIAHAITTLQKGTEQKTPAIIFLDKIVYWLALFVAIVGNFVLAVVLIPFMLSSKNMYLYLIVFIFGSFFGFLYRNLLYDIEQISQRPVIVGALFLPTVALIAMYIMSRLGYQVAQYVGLPTPLATPIIISIVYAVGFILPYFLYRQ